MEYLFGINNQVCFVEWFMVYIKLRHYVLKKNKFVIYSRKMDVSIL